MTEDINLKIAAIIERYEAAKDSLNLSPRHVAIFESRFGIKDGARKTLEEVGREFGVTRERIRQIEARVLDRIEFVQT